MAEVGGKFRQVSFDIDPAAIPPEQGVDGQPVAKVQQTWSSRVADVAQPDLPR